MTTPTRYHIAPNWTRVEDEQICRSWIEVSRTDYVQNIENHTFWPKVKQHFDSNMGKNNVNRTCNDLLSRWNLIDEKVMKYLAAISQVQHVMNRVTIQNQFESANQFYKAMEHEDFFYFHCYHILCNQPKWQGIVGGPSTQANQMTPTAHIPHMQHTMQPMQQPMGYSRGHPIPMPHMQHMQYPMQHMQQPMQQMQQPMAPMPYMAPPMQHMAPNPPPANNVHFLPPNTPTAYVASTSKSNKAPEPIVARPATTTQTPAPTTPAASTSKSNKAHKPIAARSTTTQNVAPRPTPAASTSTPNKATKTTTARATSKPKKTSKADAARLAAVDQALAASFARLQRTLTTPTNPFSRPATARPIAQSTSRVAPVAPKAKPSKGKNNVAARPAVAQATRPIAQAARPIAQAARPIAQAARPAVQTVRSVGQSAPLAPVNGNLLTSRPTTTTQQKRKAEAKSTPKPAKKIAAKKAQPLPVVQEPPKPVLTEKEKQVLELNAKKTAIAQTLKDSELMSKDLSSIANPVEREAMRKLQFEAMKRMSQKRRLRKAEQALATGENK